MQTFDSLDGKMLLLKVDAYSKWIEIFPLTRHFGDKGFLHANMF